MSGYFKAVESFPFEVLISSRVSLTRSLTELNWNDMWLRDCATHFQPKLVFHSIFVVNYLLHSSDSFQASPASEQRDKIQEFFNVQ